MSRIDLLRQDPKTQTSQIPYVVDSWPVTLEKREGSRRRGSPFSLRRELLELSALWDRRDIDRWGGEPGEAMHILWIWCV